MIEGRGGRKVRVIDSIGSQWEEVAKALDIGQEDIDIIKTTHSDNDEEACREMLTTWLEGNHGEVSWTAFSQALIDAGLPELADSLKDVLMLSNKLSGPVQLQVGQGMSSVTQIAATVLYVHNYMILQ